MKIPFAQILANWRAIKQSFKDGLSGRPFQDHIEKK